MAALYGRARLVYFIAAMTPVRPLQAAPGFFARVDG